MANENNHLHSSQPTLYINAYTGRQTNNLTKAVLYANLVAYRVNSEATQ